MNNRFNRSALCLVCAASVLSINHSARADVVAAEAPATPAALNPPLLQAASQGRADAVGVLLAQGADPNARGARGRTALMQAAMAGHYDTVRLLLTRGAARDLKDHDGATAFDHAFKHQPNSDIVALLRDAS